MNNEFIIRIVSESDKFEWINMWDEYINVFYKATVAQEITNNTWNKFFSDENVSCLVICTKENIPIGFLTYILHFNTWKLTPVCYLQDLFIKNKYRKLGAAKQLLNNLRNVAISNNWSRIYWFTKPDNTTARVLYDKIANVVEWIRYDMQL
jgi:ribosomal protein S18 acetylase RimI-like enzyme